MNTILTAALFFGCLVGVVLLGKGVSRCLPEHHRSGDSKDAVKLAMGLVATMTALLLGLLISSAKDSYDAQRSEVIQIAAKVTFLDRVLALYGPEAADARARFHGVVTGAFQQMWPDKTGQPVQLRSTGQGADEVYFAIQSLSPGDEMQRSLKAQATTLATDLGQLRALLLAQSAPSISKPLLVAVFFWLMILFFSFSLIAPGNTTTTLALIAAALSVAIAVFLILELDHPLGGLIHISGEPLRNALDHFTK
jgi:hypothetical protein